MGSHPDPGGVVKTGWTVLKIAIHSAFSPNSPLEFGILDLQNLGRPTVQGLKTQMSLYTFKRAMMHYVCKPGI